MAWRRGGSPRRTRRSARALGVLAATIGGERHRITLGELLPRAITREGVVFAHHIREGRFQRGLALIAAGASVLGGFEVLTEHYRGSYAERVMYSPVLLSPPLAAAGVWAVFSHHAARTALPLASLALLADGALGFVFHIRGVAHKPGGWRIPVVNVVMGPPVFAPLLLGISGFLGLIAAFLRRGDAPKPLRLPFTRPPRPAWMDLLPRPVRQGGVALAQDIREGRFQRLLAAAAAVSALLNGAEATYSHYQNAFEHTSQWTPVVLAPVIAAAGIGGVFSRKLARTVLPIVSLVATGDGLLGFVLHARGVLEEPGGLRAPLYNLTYGPPVFAPLLFAASGFLGVLASLLRRES